jgi:hypothetical protein
MPDVSTKVASWSFRQNGPYSKPTSITLIANIAEGQSQSFEMDPEVAQDLLRQLSLMTQTTHSS